MMTGFLFDGGATRDRTADLLHAMQALSQLSYNPTKVLCRTVSHPAGINGGATRDRTADLLHAMQALSQLSYNPTKVLRRTASHPAGINGGATRDRTADLLHAMQALSQLSYNPTTGCSVTCCTRQNMVELRGIEPRTSCMPCKRSPS